MLKCYLIAHCFSLYGSLSTHHLIHLPQMPYFAAKPPLNGHCEPEVKAPVGSNNVTLQCLIPAHPAPEVTWEIRQKDVSVNESSDNPMFSVTNQVSVINIFILVHTILV